MSSPEPCEAGGSGQGPTLCWASGVPAGSPGSDPASPPPTPSFCSRAAGEAGARPAPTSENATACQGRGMCRELGPSLRPGLCAGLTQRSLKWPGAQQTLVWQERATATRPVEPWLLLESRPGRHEEGSWPRSGPAVSLQRQTRRRPRLPGQAFTLGSWEGPAREGRGARNFRTFRVLTSAVRLLLWPPQTRAMLEDPGWAGGGGAQPQQEEQGS